MREKERDEGREGRNIKKLVMKAPTAVKSNSHPLQSERKVIKWTRRVKTHKNLVFEKEAAKKHEER